MISVLSVAPNEESASDDDADAETDGLALDASSAHTDVGYAMVATHATSSGTIMNRRSAGNTAPVARTRKRSHLLTTFPV